MRLRLLLRLLLLGLLLLLISLLLLLVVVRWLIGNSMIRLTFVGRRCCHWVLTRNIRSSPSAARIGTTGTMLITTGWYRRVRLSLSADIATTVRSTHVSLHAKSPILLLSSAGCERNLQAVTSYECA